MTTAKHSKTAAPLPEDAVGAPRKPRGFAAMTPEMRAELSRKGGVAAHQAGSAHEFTPAEAREAGRKGGAASQAKRKAAAE
jgi:hypothetical protein